MTPGILNRVHFGDAYALMQGWPADFVDTTVTSVPYWQQRDYLAGDHPLKRFEMGAESTIEKYLCDMTDLFAQVYRITKPSGCLWLNVGDKFAGPTTKRACPGYHEGELLGIPWKLSEAIRANGWRRILEVVWHKTNANPEASLRRPTLAHEHVFLFAKGPHHHFDPWAIQEPAAYPHKPRGSANPDPDDGRDATAPLLYRRSRSVWPIPTVSLDGRKLIGGIHEGGKHLIRNIACEVHGIDPSVSAGILFDQHCMNPICSCEPVTDDFFAAMPPLLAERCVLSGSSEAGCCPECGSPYKRMVKKDRVATRPISSSKSDMSGRVRRDPGRHVTFTETVGWESTCKHAIGKPTRSVVFDPFVGSGTTPLVAAATGRDWIGCELNPACAKKLAPARIKAGWQRSPVL